eukprot:Awhi_evm1s4165
MWSFSLFVFMAMILCVKGGERLSDHIIIGKARLYDCTRTYTFGTNRRWGNCNNNKVVHKVACRDSYCGTMELQCCSIEIYGGKQALAQGCYWGPTWLSHKTWESGNDVRRSNHDLVSGMRCR